MNSRVSFLFGAIAPLVLALCIVAVAVNYQIKTLKNKQAQVFKKE
jgi:signal transduction histidine kinase